MGNKVRRKNRQEISLLQEDKENTRNRTKLLVRQQAGLRAQRETLYCTWIQAEAKPRAVKPTNRNEEKDRILVICYFSCG